MKRNEVMALIVTTILMFAVCLSASAKGKKDRANHPCIEMNYGYCLDDASFNILYNKVKKASFDDNKFDLIEVASLGCYYSCNQVARIMKIFPFDDEQLKALRMMAPHIVDPQNAIVIYQLFSFDSEKQKVGEILRNSRQSD
jgi:hypothetical protein